MVGPTYAKRLAKLKIETVGDLIYHFPHRYQDFSLISDISRLQPGETVTVQAQAVSIKNEYTRSRKKIQKAVFTDGKNFLEVTWFNQPFLIKTIRVGEGYNLSGKVDWFGRKLTLVSPEYELIKDGKSSIHTGRLVPIYPETYGVSSKWLRSRIAPVLKQTLPELDDFLPQKIREKNNLIDLPTAINSIHFPKNKTEAEEAKKRLAFDELFLIQLSGLKRKQDWQKTKLSNKLKVDQERVLELLQSLPFELTTAQKRSVREILSDLSTNEPMNRLLEGDVGSGKTVVAAIAIYVSFLNGYKSILMAPTQILASQHFKTLNQLLSPLGVKIEIVTSAQKSKKTPKADLVIGTHALLFKKELGKNIGLVVIDEQHRFGVEQRAKLIKAGKTPHVLTMTATPIPRTIALTLYGDLDLSVIDEMPEGRQKVTTWVVPPQKRKGAYDWIRKHVKGTDEQAFIICPLIEESSVLQEAKAATVEYERLSKEIFPDLKLGLLHGRIKAREKDKIMDELRSGKLDILVATPVVEVGIDIPKATIMMIEAADRFGLAQLHQLRGRVGRGAKKSYCLLFTQSLAGRATKRLKAMEKLFIGIKLAELDLEMRGPGEIYGTAQHGFPDLRVASFTDLSLIKKTRKAAEEALPNLEKLPLLAKRLEEHTAQVEPN